MEARGWDELDILIVTGDAYVDHPAFGPVADRALPRGARLPGRASSRSRDWRLARATSRAGPAAALLRRHRRQPRLDAQQAHRAEEDPLARTSTRPGGAHRTCGPNRATHRLRQPAAAQAFPGRADRARRHRGVAAPHRPLRLLDRPGAPLDPARRQGRPARLRHGRAAGLGGRRPARRAASTIERHPRRARHRATSINERRDGSRSRPTRAAT